MKKKTFPISLFLLLPSLLFAEDFVSCTENADTAYSSEERSLKDAYEEEVSVLENSKDLAVKDAFHIMSIRTSFTKMKLLRAEYKAKIAENETLFKQRLESLSQKHEEAVKLCSLEKKEMGVSNEN